MTEKIGYIGLGAMGGALSAHLIGAHELTVFDRNKAAVEAMAAKGARAAPSAAELARHCDVVLLCLPRSSDVHEVLFGPDGIAEALMPGTLLIDQTSGVPLVTMQIAEKLSGLGVEMVDAPVSGGIPAAQSGRVTVIASGPDTAWARAEPVLNRMTSKVYRCSDRVGDGQALKLVNNAIGGGYRMATLELVALARKAGLGLAGTVAAINAGPAANFTSTNMLAGLVEGRSTTDFALLLMIKDLNQALALGAATGSAMPVTSAARSLMQMGCHLFGDGAKLDDVIPLIERLSGMTFADGSEAAPSTDTDAALPGQIELGIVTCNLIAVSECVAAGKSFGLSPAEMARILNVGSAWSAISADILPALEAGRAPELRWSLGEAAAALDALEALAARHALPALIPGLALGLVRDAVTRHGAEASLGKLTFGYDRG